MMNSNVYSQGPRREYPRICLHHLFENQVERTAEAVAIVFEGQQFTYAELNRRANRVAHALVDLGVGPDMPVSVAIDRDVDMVAAVVGVLKAGGAYLPLDPAYPRERLEYMLRDSGTPIIITRSSIAANLPPSTSRILLIEECRGFDDANVTCAVTSDDLAYLIYTSGSTGEPKAVMVRHANICNYLFWRKDNFPLRPDDRLLQNSSLSFDDSVWEIFEPLMTGARLVLPGLSISQGDMSRIVRLMVQQGITAACFVPSILAMLIEEHGFDECTALRRVTTGGEVLSAELVGRFFARTRAGLHNGYGPTEATISATFWTCRPGEQRATVPLGRPIANVNVYVLDDEQIAVPVGSEGEIYIGGTGVARGYLNRPQLTAERFLPDPFHKGGRMYRTGDRGRWSPDGNLEFIGRVDQQVKVRGVRIELTEIEAALRRHPHVNAAAAVVRGDFPAVQIVAFVATSVDLRGRELRLFLSQKLPMVMLPAQILVRRELPLLPNGKVDREALAQTAREQGAALPSFQVPRTATENALLHIWSEVMDGKRLGSDHDFFELGGDSLQATRVLARIRERFGVDLSLQSFFEYSTITALAALLDGRHSSPRPPRVSTEG